MISLGGPILPAGVLIDVLVGLPAAKVRTRRLAGSPVPQPMRVRALADTGAEVTCVDPRVIVPLIAAGLAHSRMIIANRPATGGVVPALEYTVGLTIPHPTNDPRTFLNLRELEVVELALAQFGYDVLLGRDVLARCLLVYDGPSNRFTLGY